MIAMDTPTDTSPDAASVLRNVEAIAADCAGQRAERQRRRHLDPADFERLREAGFLQACLPAEHGGLWESHRSSDRLVYESVRTLLTATPRWR
jgi:alkylation response protein AidB-like acyl-CoA dehydrogenase